MEDPNDVAFPDVAEMSLNLHFHRCDVCHRTLGCNHGGCLHSYTGPYRGGMRVIVERCKKCVKESDRVALGDTIDDAVDAPVVNHESDSATDYGLRFD